MHIIIIVITTIMSIIRIEIIIICSNACAYADNVIILPTCSALKRLIVICEHYGVEYDFLFIATTYALLTIL